MVVIPPHSRHPADLSLWPALKTPTVPHRRVMCDPEPEIITPRVERSKDPPLENILQ